jgi:hypothetical protein
MTSLIWKELRENVKWLPLPILLILGPTALLGPHNPMNMGRLVFAGMIAAVFAAVLGYLQVHPESRGDKRSLLLHRPLSRSRIFLGKALAGGGLYLVALGVPFACVTALAATPGHLAQPFSWPMALPWCADVLTGLVYYFAGMLAAQMDGRWYGSRCLGLASGLFCSIVVYAAPEFWHALLAILVLGGTVAVAAWGSFCSGGVYAVQPRQARVALCVTLLLGLFVVGFVAKTQLGRWWIDLGRMEGYLLDRDGRLLEVHQQHEEFRVTDLEGKPPQGVKSEHLDFHTLMEMEAPQAAHGGVDLAVRRSYRSGNRTLVKHGNDTKPANENWWYVPDEGCLVGYDKFTKRPIGSFGPDGFAPAGTRPTARFEGPLFHYSNFPEAIARDYLAFPGGVYRVDFGTRSVHTLYVPSRGRTVLWASRWEDERERAVLAFVGTDTSVEVVDESGRRVFSMPLAFDLASCQVQGVGRLENPRRYWIWFEPQWYLEPALFQTLSGSLVEYDDSGHELAWRFVPSRPGDPRRRDPRMLKFEPTYFISFSGLATPPTEFALLAAIKQYLVGEVRRDNGREMWPVLTFLYFTTQFYLPSTGYVPSTPRSVEIGFVSLMLASAVLSGCICFFLCRRYAFGRSSCLGWALCGLLLGPFGLVLLLAVQEWPARIVCPTCRALRIVTRESCEHCGRAHALPVTDGTEVFEPAAPAADLAWTAN